MTGVDDAPVAVDDVVSMNEQHLGQIKVCMKPGEYTFQAGKTNFEGEHRSMWITLPIMVWYSSRTRASGYGETIPLNKCINGVKFADEDSAEPENRIQSIVGRVICYLKIYNTFDLVYRSVFDILVIEPIDTFYKR